jgi:hypothetical protein
MAWRDRHAATTTELRGRFEHWARVSARVVDVIWTDQPARWCGIAALALLWLTAALLELAFFALFVAAIGALWLRLEHLPEEQEPSDDWF